VRVLTVCNIHILYNFRYRQNINEKRTEYGKIGETVRSVIFAFHLRLQNFY